MFFRFSFTPSGTNLMERLHCVTVIFSFTRSARVSSLSRIHNHTQTVTLHAVGLLWKSDQPDAQTSTWQHTALKTDTHTYMPSAGFRTRNPFKQELSHTLLRPRGHRDHLWLISLYFNVALLVTEVLEIPEIRGTFLQPFLSNVTNNFVKISTHRRLRSNTHFSSSDKPCI